jgi:hypothetical protein
MSSASKKLKPTCTTIHDLIQSTIGDTIITSRLTATTTTGDGNGMYFIYSWDFFLFSFKILF